ncbi:MAG: hypothetical protein CMK07_00295 [Ponticaulis sp.]|nr:hypothetical protein [Ponticaulis sp.]
MGILGSLFGGSAKTPLDPCEGHPLCAEGLSALASEDWHKLTQLYTVQQSSDRYHWLQGIGMSVPLDFSIRNIPDGAVSDTILGAIWTCLAFRFRGASVASQVSETAAMDMWTALEYAEAYLSDARNKLPDDTVIPSLMLRCALGSETYRDRLDELTSAAMATPEHCLFGAFNALTCKTEKWLGSRDKMWRFAISVQDNPPNAAWLGLTARAYIEDWLWFAGFEDDKDARNAFQKDYRSSDYNSKIEALDDAFWAGYAREIQRSELMFAHNNFGGLLSNLGLRERAKPHIEAIGRHRASTPWAYTHSGDDTLNSWNSVRKAVGLPKLDD